MVRRTRKYVVLWVEGGGRRRGRRRDRWYYSWHHPFYVSSDYQYKIKEVRTYYQLPQCTSAIFWRCWGSVCPFPLRIWLWLPPYPSPRGVRTHPPRQHQSTHYQQLETQLYSNSL